jgi:calcineurin-like phosphoesterase family protein
MNTFLISDTHFGHANILNFKKSDGTPLREGFTDIKEHDLELIKRWNYVVGKNDKVYHLGDVGFTNFPYVKNIFDNLNGEKILIKGNHDNFKLSQYAQIFKDVRAVHTLDKIVLSHIPLHPMCLDRWKGNAHGHLHEHLVYDGLDRYVNVCVEHIDYSPIEFESVREYFNS